MQNNAELNSLQAFFNKCHYSVLIKKPSWLKYYCLSKNEPIGHFVTIREYECFTLTSMFDSFIQLKEYYENFKENPSQDAIMYEYVKWKEWM